MTEAPRWRLTEPHYLNVEALPDGTRIEWEHKETARETGRTVRKLFPVPMLLDPKDPADFNHSGEIIVTIRADDARLDPRDYVFAGKPTPGMEPLNEAAEAITNAERGRWEHPIDSLPANGGMNAAESAFMAKMMEAFIRSAPVPNQTVPQSEYDTLKERLAKLEAAIASKAAPAAERRA